MKGMGLDERQADQVSVEELQSEKRKAGEARFVSEVKAAEESVAQGNYVTLAQLHEKLGV